MHRPSDSQQRKKTASQYEKALGMTENQVSSFSCSGLISTRCPAPDQKKHKNLSSTLGVRARKSQHGDSPANVKDATGSQGLLPVCFLLPTLSTESFKNHVQDAKVLPLRPFTETVCQLCCEGQDQNRRQTWTHGSQEHALVITAPSPIATDAGFSYGFFVLFIKIF